MSVENHVTGSTSLVEEGRPPWISLTLRTDSGDRREHTFRMSPAVAFLVADAIARHALRLDPKIGDVLRERLADARAREIMGEPPT